MKKVRRIVVGALLSISVACGGATAQPPSWPAAEATCKANEPACFTACAEAWRNNVRTQGVGWPGGPVCAFAAVTFVEEHAQTLSTDPVLLRGQLPWASVNDRAYFALAGLAQAACDAGHSERACKARATLEPILKPAGQSFPGEATVVPVEPTNKDRWLSPAWSDAASFGWHAARDYNRDRWVEPTWSDWDSLWRELSVAVPSPPYPIVPQWKSEATAVLSRMLPPIDLSRLPDAVKQRAQANLCVLPMIQFGRAKLLGALAQADYTRPAVVSVETAPGVVTQQQVPVELRGESAERKGRLRAVALKAAISAYKEALDVAIPEACVDQANKNRQLYDYALLLEQSSDREGATTVYKQLLAGQPAGADGKQAGPPKGAIEPWRLHEALAFVAESAKDPAQDLIALGELEQALDVVDCNAQMVECPETPLGRLVLKRLMDHLGGRSPARLASWTQKHDQREHDRLAAALKADEDRALWPRVVRMADENAQMRWIVEYTIKNHTQPGSVIQRAEAAIVRQTLGGYCPAKKAFVAKKGATEFSKLAALHCKDEPPIGSGTGPILGGANVILTTQCQTIFATPCP